MVRETGPRPQGVTFRDQHCAVPKSRGNSNMEVVVGTYEQVLVGFDVLIGEDELEVAYELVKCNLNFSLLLV